MTRKLLLILVIFVKFLSAGSAGGAPEYRGSYTFYEDEVKTQVLDSIKALTAPEMQGRLTGSPGNQLALDWLAEQLEILGIEPLPGYESLKIPYQQAVLTENSAAVVHARGAEGSLVLEPGVDFQVLIRRGVRIQGDTVAGLIRVDSQSIDAKWVSEQSDKAVMISAEDFDLLSRDVSIMQALFHPERSPEVVLLVLPEQITTMPRGVFLTEEKYPTEGPIFLQVSHKAAEELSHLSNPELQIHVDHSVAQRVVYNLGGQIGGSRLSAPPIIISAHFDGQGTIADGPSFPSAVDNASGTAAVLQMARELSRGAWQEGGLEGKMKSPPPLWIVFFNGEEQGLQGSRGFVRQMGLQALSGARVINLDMIGFDDTSPLMIAAASGSTELGDKVAAGFMGFPGGVRRMTGGMSDHANFGTDSQVSLSQAVTLVESTYPYMHSSEDTWDKVDLDHLVELIHRLVDLRI